MRWSSTPTWPSTTSLPPSPPDTPPVAEIDSALAAIAPAAVSTGVRAITAADVDRLFAPERAAISRAVDRRRHEFASGRALLRELIGEDVAIGVGDDRRPVLPDDIHGSLAHDDVLAVAAISRDPRVRAVGIDVEPATPLTAALAATILRPDEEALDAHLAFTLKEAAYKAWSSLGGRLLDHQEMHVRTRPDGTFRAVALDGDPPFRGRWTTAGGRHLALVVVLADRDHDAGVGLSNPPRNS
jgi:4'-phosphopantetheinyl transferase EntD